MLNLAKKLSDNKVAIAIVSIVVLGGVALTFSGINQVEAATVGTNYVNAKYCQQLTNGIAVIPSYIVGRTQPVAMTNGCKDLGHGMRNYTYTCIPKTKVYRNITSSPQVGYQYSVSWAPCGR